MLDLHAFPRTSFFAEISLLRQRQIEAHPMRARQDVADEVVPELERTRMKKHTALIRLLIFPFVAIRAMFSGLNAAVTWLIDDTYCHRSAMEAFFKWLKPIE